MGAYSTTTIVFHTSRTALTKILNPGENVNYLTKNSVNRMWAASENLDKFRSNSDAMVNFMSKCAKSD
jgi:hypothetical protein